MYILQQVVNRGSPDLLEPLLSISNHAYRIVLLEFGFLLSKCLNSSTWTDTTRVGLKVVGSPPSSVYLDTSIIHRSSDRPSSSDWYINQKQGSTSQCS